MMALAAIPAQLGLTACAGRPVVAGDNVRDLVQAGMLAARDITAVAGAHGDETLGRIGATSTRCS